MTGRAFHRTCARKCSPFLRLDDARNQDEGGTGLGLAIARDIARSHGGDITLGDSPMGGLRATVRVPV
jgi:two-component system osmolarity sensor histidine kinase EnvZ